MHEGSFLEDIAALPERPNAKDYFEQTQQNALHFMLAYVATCFLKWRRRAVVAVIPDNTRGVAREVRYFGDSELRIRAARHLRVRQGSRAQKPRTGEPRRSFDRASAVRR